ncbi:phosphomannomutase [Deinococcus peraridilitoris]|uniref:Phosphomannomutase n=1 Tax=Deinococcus peraridilitoris (strain DSM 19664 / LMG 22246 / CIP 109416 / KR-200) TaxID=937777 RepID=L0A5V2_DEIPD|nr:phosphomannomutase [Deinococcus peraridilitoris]AFZ68400.1 phosphomannomutase [Deinococcus peraridilitoris DSM 19664]
MPIKFGTDGWRDIIAEDFTHANVAIVAAAHARYLASQGGQSVVIGFDPRFGGPQFARVAANTFAQHGLNVHLAGTYLPTPALSFAARHLGAAGGVMITASHNPPEYSGYKLKGAYGGSATPSMVSGVEQMIDEGDDSEGPTGTIQNLDVRRDYYMALDAILDLDTLRAYRGTLYHDAMGGAGSGWIEGYVKHAKLKLDLHPVHGVPHPLFYDVNPEPIPQNLGVLSALLRQEEGLTFGTVTDGDADRVGAVVAGGIYFNSHQIFAVLIKHLYDRGLRGRVIKTVSGSSIIDLLCQKLGLEVVETPVGFKYITDAFLEGLSDPAKQVLIGGEESGGIGMGMHIPERDGILNSLLMLEAVAKSGKSLPELFADIEELTGFRHFYDRNDLHLDPAFDKFAALQRAKSWQEVAGHTVREVVTKDGVKLLLEGNAWVMLRASGTEPVVRVYAEGTSEEAMREILEEATRRVQEE